MPSKRIKQCEPANATLLVKIEEGYHTHFYVLEQAIVGLMPESRCLNLRIKSSSASLGPIINQMAADAGMYHRRSVVFQ